MYTNKRVNLQSKAMLKYESILSIKPIINNKNTICIIYFTNLNNN